MATKTKNHRSSDDASQEKQKKSARALTPAPRHRNLVTVSLQKQAGLGNTPQWFTNVWVWSGHEFKLSTVRKTSVQADLASIFQSEPVPSELVDEMTAFFNQTNAAGIIQILGVAAGTTDISSIVSPSGPLWYTILGDDAGNLAKLFVTAEKFVFLKADHTTSKFSELDKIVYVNGSQEGLLGAIVGTYLANAQSFGFYAPMYGLQVQGVTPMSDETMKNACSSNNINFYCEANEDNPTGQFMIKEGVGATGEDIDKTFAFYYMKLISTQKFIQFLLSNGGINMKMSGSSLLKNKLNNIFSGFQNANLITEFSFASEPMVQDGVFNAAVGVIYNGTIKEYKLIILEGSVD